MTTDRTLRTFSVEPAMGVAILTILAIHAVVEKTSATRVEMLYLCHLSSATIAAGLLSGSLRLVSSAFLSLAVLGTPSWLIYSAITRDVTATSVLAHLVPLFAAAMTIRERGLARGAAVGAIAICCVSVVFGAFFAKESMNLNLAFRPGPGLEWLRVSTIVWRCLLLSGSFVLLLAAERLVRRFVA